MELARGAGAPASVSLAANAIEPSAAMIDLETAAAPDSEAVAVVPVAKASRGLGHWNCACHRIDRDYENHDRRAPFDSEWEKTATGARLYLLLPEMRAMDGAKG